MRVNMPVTGVERLMRDGTTIASRTDTRGVITWVNPYFCEISGYAEAELLGAPHNLLRHPDMPPEAFKDLWDTLQKGKPWTGYVKNRAKNGDHYWVKANVAPIREHGQITGYLSVRTAPDRAAVEAHEAAYHLFREGKATGLAIEEGQAVQTTPVARMIQMFQHATIKTRLQSTLAFLLMLMLVIGGVGLWSLNRDKASMHDMYEHAAQAQHLASQIQMLIAENRAQVALAVQHDPEQLANKLHDHEVDVHLNAIVANKEKITKLLGELENSNSNPKPRHSWWKWPRRARPSSRMV